MLLQGRFAGVALIAVLFAGACSGSTSPTAAPSATPTAASSATPSAASSVTPTAAALVPPDRIKQAGLLSFCVNVTQPPEEFYKADGTMVGSDIEIAQEIGQRWGVKVQFTDTNFDGIIAALNANKCDLIISGMTVTPERSKAVDYVPYLSVGFGLLVPAVNSKGIKSMDDLSGLNVAVQLATTDEEALVNENTKLAAAGKKPMTIVSFPQDTDAFQQLSLGRVDAYLGDAPTAVYYSTQAGNAGKFVVAAAVNALPIGIAVRKTEPPLKDAVSAAIDAMYADGTMKRIVDKWGLTDAVQLIK